LSLDPSPPETVWAVVPVKLLERAKSRLAGVLDAPERRALTLAMLSDLLTALAATRGVGGTIVVTADETVRAFAEERGAGVVPEPASRGEPAAPSLSRAVTAGTACAFEAGAEWVLYLPADLPLATPAALERLLAAARSGGGALVRATRDAGTNVLCLPPTSGFAFDFGPGSAARHLEAAAAVSLALTVVEEPALSLDVDLPEDLTALAAGTAPGAASRGWLRATRGGFATSGAGFRGRSDEAASVRRASLRGELPRALAERAAAWPLPDLMALAAEVRDARPSPVLTYSPKVFIPLTRLCRDVCHYCSFAKTPRHLEHAYLSREAVLELAESGRAAGCTEALFTLGDRPERRYREAREALAAFGHDSTVGYLAEVAGLVLERTGLLPHINAGVLSEAEYRQLRPVAASMGLMLESTSRRLLERGGAHYGSPDKDPAQRLESMAAAGRLRIPFTSGLLIGIGETPAERLDALYALRELHEAHGHLQEIIIQNFVPKADTPMRAVPAATTEALLSTLALARLVFGPAMSLQVPPNLNPEALDALLDAGLNDFGGISPVTPDHVNPESPWPEIEALRGGLARRGRALVPRLTIYPEFIARRHEWIDPGLQRAVLAQADAEGLGGREPWRAGVSGTPPLPAATRRTEPARSGSAWRATAPGFAALLARATAGEGLSESELVRLFAARGEEVDELLAAADALRRAVVGDTVTYVVNRNINYTNLCTYHCSFCAFAKGRAAAGLRGPGYLLGLDEIARRVAEAGARGATEVCLQGGIHPSFTGETYLAICRAAKAADPGIHIHAFSPLEIRHGAETLGVPVARFLERLQDAGLATLPGTAAEVLDDQVRRELCPDKLSTAEWLEIVGTAHEVGFKTTSTIMFGHIDEPRNWARHLIALRSLQARTGGITEFVPLPFIADEAPLYVKRAARPGPTWRETLLMHAVARLALHPLITNVQASWVKLGPAGAAAVLAAGVNDLGGTLMNESISRAAGAVHGQEFPPERMAQLIESCARRPRQRTTLYGTPAPERVARSFGAAPLTQNSESISSRSSAAAEPACRIQDG
jgi:FO synthase